MSASYRKRKEAGDRLRDQEAESLALDSGLIVARMVGASMFLTLWLSAQVVGFLLIAHGASEKDRVIGLSGAAISILGHAIIWLFYRWMSVAHLARRKLLRRLKGANLPTESDN